MRRGRNIYRRKGGRWEGRYIKGTRAVYGYVYARTFREAKEKLDDAKDRMHRVGGIQP